MLVSMAVAMTHLVIVAAQSRRRSVLCCGACGDNLELIRWLRRWDDWCDDALGVPETEDRTMLFDEWSEEQRRKEPPTATK